MEIFKNTRRVLAMELMCSCQAIDLGSGKTLGKATGEAYNMIRAKVDKLLCDREMYEDINNLESLLTYKKLNEITDDLCGGDVIDH